MEVIQSSVIMSHVTYLSQSNLKNDLMVIICIFKIIMEELPLKKDRIKGQSYLYQGNIRIWDGKELKCEHNKRMSRCIECGGSEICEHKKRRTRCKICGGSEICEHQRQKSKCIDCNGIGICKHKKIRSTCKICGGTSICEHQKRRSQCIDCNGRSICEHQRIRSTCKICGGSEICEHNKRKSYCKICGGSALCKSLWCSTRAIKKYENYCLSCFVNNPENAGKTVVRNYKTKELHVVDHIKKIFPNHQWIHDKRINGGCSQRRPDLILDLLTHVIIVEIDEEQHSDYSSICESMRTMQLSQDNAHRPSVFIRFNPDSYMCYGQKIPSCFTVNKLGICVISKKQIMQWNNRLEVLREEINKWINVDVCNLKTVQEVYLFYNK